MDVEMRAAERSGDLPRLIKARSRAGRCPGCGDPGKHADEKVKTILVRFRTVGLPVHDEQAYSIDYIESPEAPEATGEWQTGQRALADPCGFLLAFGGATLPGVELSPTKIMHADTWRRHRAGVLGRQCASCTRAADVMSPDFVLFWRNTVARRAGLSEQDPFPMCYQCVEKEREESLDTLGESEEDHSISVEEES